MKDVLLNGNTGFRDYKNLSWEGDRKICTKYHWLASLGLKSNDRGDNFFYPIITQNDRFFILLTIKYNIFILIKGSQKFSGL